MPQVGLMVLVHQRPQLLRLIVEQAVETWPDAVIDFGQDRPSTDVAAQVYLLQRDYPNNVTHWNCPFPAIAHREQFLELRQLQLERLHDAKVKYLAMWDDDHILADPEEAKRCLADNPTLVYCHKLYMWDSPSFINLGLPGHNSVLFSRRLEGDRFGTNMVNAPAEVMRKGEGNFVQMKTWLMDIGYMTASERKRVWEVYKRAGKIDDLTLGLMRAPKLHPVEKDLAGSKWYLKLKEAFR
jgi:hypothetical protein